MSKSRTLRRWVFRVTYTTFVGAGFGVILWLLATQDIPPGTWTAVVPFFIFLVIADWKLSEFLLSEGRVMSSKPIVLSAIALFGPAPAAAMEAMSALLRGFFIRRASVRKTLFNAAMLGAAAGLAGLVYRALPFHADFRSPAFFLPLIAAIIVHSVVNSFMLGVIISLDSHVPFQRIYRREFSHFGINRIRGLLDPPFAAMIVLLYQQTGAWALVLFLFPVLALYQSDRLYQRNKEAHINSIAALSTALEADDPYTHGHSYRVAKLAVRVGRAMGMNDRDLETLEYGGLLHDVGKIAISNEIICKPGRLTDTEFQAIRAHPTIGADIVEQIKFLEKATDLVRHHHERPDGRGYPNGLTKDEISIGCAILNVCDAFDAMTTDRPYRKALTIEKTMEELVRFKGTQFDERVVDVMLRLYHQGEFVDMREMRAPEVAFAPHQHQLIS